MLYPIAVGQPTSGCLKWVRIWEPDQGVMVVWITAFIGGTELKNGMVFAWILGKLN